MRTYIKNYNKEGAYSKKNSDNISNDTENVFCLSNRNINFFRLVGLMFLAPIIE